MISLQSKKNDLTQKVLKGSFFNMISAIVTNVTRFFLVFILARYYIKEEFGVWITITSITAVLATGDFGIGNALRNKLSSLIAKNDKEADQEAEKIFLVVFLFFLVFTTLLCIALFLLQDIIPLQSLFKSDNESLQNIGKQIIVWVQVLLIIGIPFSISSTCFYSYHESKYVANLNIAQALLSFVVICILALSKQSIILISIFYFFSSLAMYIAGTGIFLRKRRWNLLNLKLQGATSILIDMLKKGFPFFALQISSAFLFNSGTIIISSSIGLSEATEYNLVQKLYLFVLGIYQTAFNPMWAGYAQAINTQAWAWCKNTFKNSLLITIAVFGLATLAISILGNFALGLLAGEKYVAQSILFTFIGIWITLYSLWACAQTLQSAVGNIRLLVVTTLIAAFTIAPFSKLLIGEFGVFGLLWAQIIIYLILTIVTVTEAYLMILNKMKYQSVKTV